MTSETLYAPRGAGHRAPEWERRGYVQPRDEAMEAFGRWLDSLAGENTSWLSMEVRKRYGTALEHTKALGIGPMEACPLIGAFDSHPMARFSGIFLSAAINSSDTRTFVFDMDRKAAPPLDYVGYMLPEDKNIVILSETGSWTAFEASGVVINDAECEDLGYTNTIPTPRIRLVNYHTMESDLCDNMSGLIVNFGDVYEIGRQAKTDVLTFGEVENGILSDGMSVTYTRSRKLLSIERTDMSLSLRIEGGEWSRHPELEAHVLVLKDGLGPGQPYEDVIGRMRDLDLREELLSRVNWDALKWGAYKRRQLYGSR